MSKTYAIPPAAPQNHGETPAAWVMLFGVVGGAIVAALGLILGSTLVLVIGAAVIALAIIASVALKFMGFGQKTRVVESPSK